MLCAVYIVFKNVFCYCCIVIFIICIISSKYTHNITRCCTDHDWFYNRPILMETIGASLEIVLTTFLNASSIKNNNGTISITSKSCFANGLV